MEKLYKGMKAIILFLIITILIETVAGEKVAEKMTLFVLLGMFIIDGTYTENLAEFLENLTE